MFNKIYRLYNIRDSILVYYLIILWLGVSDVRLLDIIYSKHNFRFNILKKYIENRFMLFSQFFCRCILLVFNIAFYIMVPTYLVIIISAAVFTVIKTKREYVYFLFLQCHDRNKIRVSYQFIIIGIFFFYVSRGPTTWIYLYQWPTICITTTTTITITTWPNTWVNLYFYLLIIFSLFKWL